MIRHFDNKWRVEETVRRLGFPSHVIIRPVFFMDNFLSAWFKPGIDQGKVMIGEIDIAGDAHTVPDTAKILSKATGRTITFERVPIAEVRKASEDYALMLEWFDRVGYNADIPALAKKYGIKPTSLAEWAATAKWS